MFGFVRILAALLSEALSLVLLFLCSSSEIRAENLVLRKQLAQYIERGVKPRRVDSVTRIGLALLLKNHARSILACDFFVAVTVTFRLLYVFVVIEHGRRRLAHVGVRNTQPRLDAAAVAT